MPLVDNKERQIRQVTRCRPLTAFGGCDGMQSRRLCVIGERIKVDKAKRPKTTGSVMQKKKEGEETTTTMSADDFTRLNTIRAHDITELKALHNPPICVIKVVRAVFILLGYNPDSLEWRQCKILLSQKGGAYFLNTIMNFEVNMSSEKAINTAINELKDIDMETVLNNSAAVAGMFIWCLKVVLK